MALSGSGSVYTWGGGADGQLGFGNGTLFLSEPKCLPRLSFPNKISQIACGELYSAAVTVDGQIYMWGKNCHVMTARQPSSFSYFEPVAIQTHYTIGKLACGVWHAVAITGKPAWQPETEDSSDEESSEDEEVEELGQELQRKSDSDDSFVQHKKDPRSTRLSKHLSLAEFYAPTPLPAIRPISQLTERRASLQSCESAIIPAMDDQHTREVKDSEREVALTLSSVIKEGKNETLAEEEGIDFERKMESLNLLEDENRKVQYSRLSSSPELPESERVTLSSPKNRKKTGKGISLNSEPVSVSSAKGSRDHMLLTNSLVRAKSFPVFHSPSTSSHTPSKVNRMNAKGDKVEKGRAIHTKLSIYSKKNVTLKNADIVMDIKVPQPDEMNSLPATKMTRAHTFYGKMSNSPSLPRASKQKVIHRDSRSQTYFDQVVRSEKMKLSLSKIQHSSRLVKKDRGVSVPSPPRRRATFSSASSWKNGDEHSKDILISASNQSKLGGQGSYT
ncbi:E3 ubiquitin-protein ligase HERC2 [Holothuria leucospilota]|uniref:E3 ubiquitin-protein ligase HERC2 n=1 Tax=Holothuria leucospilota TaxID=206669 RepID=A0A9Q1BP05_HOLLE|nr:E3 ubiquitin-protein ligase HERC2 [Holothuria leucospilota]